MAVAAAVIAHTHFTALRAYLDMPAQMAGAADTHPPEGLAYRLRHLMTGEELIAPVSDDLPDLVSGAAHEKMWSTR